MVAGTLGSWQYRRRHWRWPPRSSCGRPRSRPSGSAWTGTGWQACRWSGTASLLVATAPVFSAVLAVVFLGERLTWLKVAGSAVAVAGSALIALAGGAGYSTAAWAVLAAALVQGVYHLSAKPLLRRYTGVEVACYAMWAGTVFLLPLAPAAVHGLLTAPASATTAVVHLGPLPSAVGFVVWGYAVARNSVATATAALYLVPVVALLAAYVWLGEIPGRLDLVGGLVSIGGVLLIRWHRPRTATVRSAEPTCPAPSGR
ncbi:MAG TPA: DMT family transporter [Pseudonocardiaceae bacterium]